MSETQSGPTNWPGKVLAEISDATIVRSDSVVVTAQMVADAIQTVTSTASGAVTTANAAATTATTATSAANNAANVASSANTTAVAAAAAASAATEIANNAVTTASAATTAATVAANRATAAASAATTVSATAATALQPTGNLGGLADVSVARQNLGLGSAALLAAGAPGGAALLDGLGNISLNSFVAHGTTTARTFAVRGADSVNVADFGAKLDGVTDDSAAFQAAYNAVPNGGTVHVPVGNLNAQITATPGKSVRWCAMGRLDAGSAVAGTNPVLSIGDGDVFEGMLGNSKFFSKDIYTNVAAGYATVRIDTNNYANTGAGGAAASLSVNATQHGSSGAAGMYAINAQSYVTGTTEAPASAWGNICISASLWVNSPKAGSSIANYAAIYDTYGDSAGMVTCEFDYFGIGADPIGKIGPIGSGRAVVLAGCGPEVENGPMTECGRGYSIGTRATGAIGVGYYANGNFYSSVFDASDATFLTTDLSGNTVYGAGLRLGPNQPIDLCGVYATNQLNHRTLRWNESSGNFEYQVGGTAVFSITDNGALALPAGAAITVGGASVVTSVNGDMGAVTIAPGGTFSGAYWSGASPEGAKIDVLKVLGLGGIFQFAGINQTALLNSSSAGNNFTIWFVGQESTTNGNTIQTPPGITIQMPGGPVSSIPAPVIGQFIALAPNGKNEWIPMFGNYLEDYYGGENFAYLRTGLYTVSTLPTGAPTSSKAAVSDALTPQFLQPVVGGGTAFCPVSFNGVAWVVG